MAYSLKRMGFWRIFQLFKQPQKRFSRALLRIKCIFAVINEKRVVFRVALFAYLFICFIPLKLAAVDLKDNLEKNMKWSILVLYIFLMWFLFFLVKHILKKLR